MKDVLPPGILIVFLIMIIIMIRMMIGIDSSKIFCRSARSYLFVLRKSVRGSRLRLLLFIYRFVTADPETQKNHSRSSQREGKDCGIFIMPHSLGRGILHASHTAAQEQLPDTLQESVFLKYQYNFVRSFEQLVAKIC